MCEREREGERGRDGEIGTDGERGIEKYKVSQREVRLDKVFLQF